MKTKDIIGYWEQQLTKNEQELFDAHTKVSVLIEKEQLIKKFIMFIKTEID